MKYFIITSITLLISLCIPFSGNAQQTAYKITGTVYEKQTGNPLYGATVVIKEISKGTSTKRDGRFSIAGIPAGDYTLVVTFLGYSPVETTLKVDRNKSIDIYMDESSLSLESIYVQARRDSLTASTRSVSILDNAKLDEQRGQTLGETLASIPGVNLLKTGPTIAKPVIRGLHSQRILLLNHGISQEGQQWGGEHAPEIDPFAPERIEVIRGAAGVEYGIGAIGGVIKVDSEDILKNPGVRGTAYLNTFTNNMQGAGSIKMSGVFEDAPGLGWRVQGSMRRAGDSRTPRDVIGNSGFRELDFAMGVNYEHDSFEHDIYYSHFGTELGIYRGSHIGNFTDLLRAIERGRPLVDYKFSYDINAPKQEISHDLIRYKGTYSLKDAGRLELQYGFQNNHRQEFDAHKRFSDDSEALNKPAFDLTLFSHTTDLKFKHKPVNGFYGTAGITGIAQTNVRSGSGFLIPNFRAYGGGVFLIENWSNDVLTLETGVRYDYQWRRVFAVENKGIEQGDYEFNSLTLVGGAMYKFADTWSVSSNFGTAWRPPGVNEQFSNGVHHGTAQFELGDPNLESEKSYSADLTLRKATSKIYAQLSGYINYIDNYIFLRPEPEPVLTIRGSFPSFSYQSNNSLLRGFDGTIEYQLLRSLSLGVSASLLWGDNLDLDEPLIFMPSNRYKFTARYNLGSIGWMEDSYFEAGATYVAEQTRFPENLDFAPPPDGYALVDLEFGTRFNIGSQKLVVNLALKNAFDTVYRDYLSRFRYFIDAPGRNLITKVQIPF